MGEDWPHGPLLPIRVILRRFAEQLPAGNQSVRAGELWAFIAKDLDDGYGLSNKTMDYVQRIARQMGAMILLDGLDECSHAKKAGTGAGRCQRIQGRIARLLTCFGGTRRRG